LIKKWAVQKQDLWKTPQPAGNRQQMWNQKHSSLQNRLEEEEQGQSTHYLLI
jgi:hypothetical protein